MFIVFDFFFTIKKKKLFYFTFFSSHFEYFSWCWKRVCLSYINSPMKSEDWSLCCTWKVDPLNSKICLKKINKKVFIKRRLLSRLLVNYFAKWFNNVLLSKVNLPVAHGGDFLMSDNQHLLSLRNYLCFYYCSLMCLYYC